MSWSLFSAVVNFHFTPLRSLSLFKGGWDAVGCVEKLLVLFGGWKLLILGALFELEGGGAEKREELA